MKILGLETSCDETAAAVLEAKNNRFKILANFVSSQIPIHQKYGGVVPEVAAREHLKSILPILDLTFKQAKINYKKIEAIAVTTGPGLLTSLLVGVETAKTLSFVWQKPLLAINHLEAHLYSNWLTNPPKIKFPLLGLIVSGGHTLLVLMKNHGQYKVLGQTLDDAAGEAFDKVAKLLKIGYPGGPAIEEKAKGGNPRAFDFPRPMEKSGDFNFSFAGLKTAVLYKVRQAPQLISSALPDLCASFQQAAVDVLVTKTTKAAQKHQVKTVILAGGVAANQPLRKQFSQQIKKIHPQVDYLLPPLDLTTDNAAMIAAAGYFHALRKNFTPWEKVKADPNGKL